MVLKHTLFFLFLIFISYSCNVSSADKKTEDDSLQYYPPTPAVLDKEVYRYYHRRIADFFDTNLLNKGFNGGILVAKEGAIIYEKYVGKIDLRKPDTLTDSTSFHIASTGKTFTGIAVLKLAEENKLHIDDSLSKYFPGFPYADITIKMLLNHRSGLPNYIYFASNNKWDKQNFATNQDVLDMLYNDRPNKSFTANSRFSYCNTNFVLLALIIEKVSGKSFPDFMQEKLFDPLQMKHTYVFTLKDTATSTHSFNYNSNYWDFDFLDATYGDKNIYSTPRDLLKWDQALYSGQLIRQNLLDAAFTPYSFEKPSKHNYGLGWRLLMIPNGKKVVYHFGKWHGFNAAFARLIDEKVTIIILGNKFNHAIYRAAHLCYDIFGDYQQGPEKGDDEIESSTGEIKAIPIPTKKKIPIVPKTKSKLRK